MKKYILYLLGAVIFGCAFLIPISKSLAASSYTLTINKNTAYGWPQGGYVTSSPSGINCNSDCSQSYSSGTSVTLTEHTYSGYRFVYWPNGGGITCSGGDNTLSTCTFTMDSNLSMSPLWEYTSINVKISKTGDGSGTVTSSSGGINCGSVCAKSFTTPHTPSTSYTTLKATPSSGSKFAGWQTSGDACYSGGGKGGAPEVNTSSTCNFYIYGTGKKTLTAVAKFTSTGGSSSSSSSSTSTSTSTTSSTTTTAKPKTPTASTVEINGDKVSAKNPISVSSDEPLALSGKTVANGLVTLIIHSTPKTVTTKADKKGNWSYTISGLEAGDHYVEAKVKDPETKNTSKLGKLLSFTVIAAAGSPSNTVANIADKTSTSSKKGMVIGIIILLLALASGSWYGWKWLKARKTTLTPPAPPSGI